MTQLCILFSTFHLETRYDKVAQRENRKDRQLREAFEDS